MLKQKTNYIPHTGAEFNACIASLADVAPVDIVEDMDDEEKEEMLNGSGLRGDEFSLFSVEERVTAS